MGWFWLLMLLRLLVTRCHCCQLQSRLWPSELSVSFDHLGCALAAALEIVLLLCRLWLAPVVPMPYTAPATPAPAPAATPVALSAQMEVVDTITHEHQPTARCVSSSAAAGNLTGAHVCFPSVYNARHVTVWILTDISWIQTRGRVVASASCGMLAVALTRTS